MSEEYKLPLDILIEIFKKLPLKSLIQLTSVSKAWRSIIRSSRFIAFYNASHIQPHQLFVVGFFNNYVDIFNDDDGGDISFLQRHTLFFEPEHLVFRSYELIGYSQGLFGFRCHINTNMTHKEVVIIWNPSIQKSVVIPSPEQQRSYRTNFVFTVCNPTDPMILKTTCYIVGSLWNVEIYKLSTGVWRSLSSAPRQSLEFSGITVIDSFIYWIASDTNPEGVKLNNLILSFDITHEQFTEICLPPCLAPHRDIDSSKLHLSKLKESLVVVQSSFDKRETGVWMMIMEPGVQNSFRKLYTVKLPHTTICPRVLGFRKNGQPIIYSESYGHKNVLLFYESDLVSFNQIDIPGYECPTNAGSYMETLLLLDH